MTDWFAAQEARVAEEIARLRARTQEQTAQLKVATSPANAPGWVFVGVEYTCIPDAVYPWSPEIVRAIWEFAPDARPLWSRWIYLAPEDRKPHVYGRHAIGRFEANPRNVTEPLIVTMPSMPCQGLTFNAPNIIEHYLKGPSQDSRPGPYVPFDHDVVQMLRSSVPGWETELVKDLAIRKPEQARARHEEQVRQEQAYVQADVDKYVDKKLGAVSDVDMKEWILYRHLRSRARRLMVFQGAR
jgi:hypothetical protein